ncbi:DUF1800 domain-containing protein [Pedobacter panaciterrae]|jgi:Uncharacterized protein conserved in bacteria|uniref:DUF1800 domain-containing protein n=1 Tax=Pedobacter panaciterrae TaxID=363849 RepID=UPI00155DC28C|nr:DUF1800 domain-containing protein [Pedobacter panaciterrae]NQX54911.1 DUF1800 domain-containing protein [Pedobacter panaciterrae]
MKTSIKILFSLVFVLFFITLCSFFQKESVTVKLKFPYKQAGLSERQAAEHMLSRFTYGPKAGDVDRVLKIGLEKWFIQQLEGSLQDEELDKMLAQFDDINLSNTDVENKYPRSARVLRMAIKDGAIDKDSVNKGNQAAYKKQIKEYMEMNGLKPQQELYRQFINQKILRAAYTNNQLRELLTDFWFNHFNVSLTKNQCASFVPAFERDVIRPNVTGKFNDLLLATAKSPAMLIYLDNFSSSGQPAAVRNDSVQTKGGNKNRKAQVKKKQGGLNENYAREVMELHTLGVDGGYDQNDVTQAARVLTGWTIAPMGEDGYGAGMKKLMDNVGETNLEKRGFVHQGDFLFVPTRHDNGEKTVLGKRFSANGGYEEGVTLLTMLAHHPSTAKFISKKIATKFVSDQPSPRLIDRMAKTFIKTDGDIKQVMIIMVSSPEFWKVDALREKTKSPFELAISAVRSLDAQITQPYQLFSWINKMGQKMYYYQAPTGFPDRGQYWINTGALLNRMNFGLALASQRIPGIKVDLAALNNNHEPESAEAALTTYSKIIMPERNLDATIKRLKPMLKDPDLNKKVEIAAEKNTPVASNIDNTEVMGGVKKGRITKKEDVKNSELAQVVGVILGSPEFQRK